MNGRAAVARRGTKWTGKTTGKPSGNSNKKDGTTGIERKMKPRDQREEAETVKKEIGKKIMIQKKRPCAKGRESEYKETKDSKKSKKGRRKTEEIGDKRKRR